MAKDSQQYTAFMVGSMGVYEFLKMLYGLCNAPATFQTHAKLPGRAKLDLHAGLLDNVIVFSWTEEEHLHRLQAMFE